jgi:hypothetical protein
MGDKSIFLLYQIVTNFVSFIFVLEKNINVVKIVIVK